MVGVTIVDSQGIVKEQWVISVAETATVGGTDSNRAEYCLSNDTK